MKRFAGILLAGIFATVCATAQQWEFGGMAGAGFLNHVNATSSIGSATAGFENGVVAGVYVGQNLYPHLSGELRYAFLQSNLRLQSGGTTATFSGNAHVIHYDILWHFNRGESRVQPFVALGGGMKIFRGTGAPAAYQPLYQVGYMTQTQQLKPMADVGAGVRIAVAHHLFLRAEFRDYITAFPNEVIAAAPGAKFGTILQDFVPMIGLSYMF